MANGLSANASKTTFIILNDRKSGAHSRKIMVGETEVSQESNAKLLGITVTFVVLRETVTILVTEFY